MELAVTVATAAAETVIVVVIFRQSKTWHTVRTIILYVVFIKEWRKKKEH
jgi:hypothetical protein